MPCLCRNRDAAANSSREFVLVVSSSMASRGDALLLEVHRRRAGLGEPVAGLAAAGDDDDRRELAGVEVGGVVEARLEHVGRPAIELRGAEHDDRLRRAGVVLASGVPHLHERDHEVPDHEQEARRDGGEQLVPPTPCRRSSTAAVIPGALSPSASARGSRPGRGTRPRRTAAGRPVVPSVRTRTGPSSFSRAHLEAARPPTVNRACSSSRLPRRVFVRGEDAIECVGGERRLHRLVPRAGIVGRAVDPVEVLGQLGPAP